MRLLDIKEVQSMQLDLMKKLHEFLQKNNFQYYLIAGSALGAVRHNGFIPWDDDIDIGMFRNDYDKFIEISKNFDSCYQVVNFKTSSNCDFGLTRIYINNTYIDNPTIKHTVLDKRLYFDIFPLDNVPNDDIELKKYEGKILKKKKLIQLIDARKYNTSTIKFFTKKLISFFVKPFRQRILISFNKLLTKYKNVETNRICSLCSQYSFKKQVMAKEIYGKPTLHEFENSSFFIPEKFDVYLTTLYGEDYMQIPPIEKRRKGYNIYLINEEK